MGLQEKNLMEQRILKKIEEIVGKDGYSTDTAVLYTYGFDASIFHNTPDVVVQPSTTEQVSELMKLANAEKIPVVPRGAGTGLCGSAVPIKGGMVIALQRMNKVLKVSVGDLWVDVEAGCIYDQLNKELSKYGFFFPPSPGSAEACQIGGMVANNASGMRAVKYGATRDFVMGLTFVKADGEIVRCGTRTIKDASGYQLARLLCGSEGTLGVITEVTLKLTTKPKKSASCLVGFKSVEDAGRCISAIIAKPLIPASCELMDSVSITAVNKALGNPLPDCNSLIIVEVDGETDEIIERDLKIVASVAEEIGAIFVKPSHDKKEIASWTTARKSVMTSLSAMKPGYSSVSLADDMGVPISKVPLAVKAFKEIADKHGVVVATYGHASDGNLHTKMLLNPLDKDEWDRGVMAVNEIFDVCIELGGTVTGEHGVGISKAPNFAKERSSELSSIIAIKKAMDPNNILNPGKLEQWEGSILTHLRYPCKEYM
jgi:glycolate oxidase